MVSRAILGKRPLIRGFWCAIFFFGLCMFLYQLSDLLGHYLHYPKRVTIEVVDRKVIFPDITVCNMRNLDLYILKIIFDVFNSSPFDKRVTTINATATKNAFVEKYVQYVNKYLKIVGDEKALNGRSSIVQQLFTRASISANFGDNILAGQMYLSLELHRIASEQNELRMAWRCMA